MRYPTFLALGLMACSSNGPPTTPSGTFAVVSTSPVSEGAIILPTAWPGDARALAPAVTIRFTYAQPIQTAIVVVDLMNGSNVCLEAEGLQTGPGYTILGAYAAGSTVTVSGNNFERNISYPLCGDTSFTTDHLRFQLIERKPPASPGGPLVNTTVLAETVAMRFTFSK